MLRLSPVVFLIMGGTAFSLLPQGATAEVDAGTLSVRVVRDVNGNGSYEPALEVGVAGLRVGVTASNGATATGTTGPDGTVAVDTAELGGQRYRVAVTIPDNMPHLSAAPAGPGLSSLTSFVDMSDGKDAQVVVGVWNPADYCQSNPALVIACHRPTFPTPAAPTDEALVTVPFTARGMAPAHARLAEQQDVGTVYGLAYRRQDQRVFSGAFAKRAAAYGPGGPGAIYATAPDGQTTLFATVPDAGSTPHSPLVNGDGAFFGVPGTESLGDLDISEDGGELYAVNLNDRKLYVYDATGATGALLGSYPIPDPGCASPADWRPGALGVRDGIVYLGGVCSGQSTQSLRDVRAVVHTFRDGVVSVDPVLVQPLDFLRGPPSAGAPQANRWNPWTNTWADTDKYDQRHTIYPQPLLTDLAVETDGDLVLGFRDRYGDMTGYLLPPPDGGIGFYSSITGGDLNRACRQPDGSYAWEGTGDCPNNAKDGNAGPQSPDVVEYYPGEYLNIVHAETAQGAMALVHGEQRMPTTLLDPLAPLSGGIGWFDRGTGQVDGNAYQVWSRTWGKSNGLGDLEALCELAPVQIGDRVWFDTDADGVQDVDEPPLPGVRVALRRCEGGEPIASGTTDANGLFYFGAAEGVVAGGCYRLEFDYSAADTSGLPGRPPPEQLVWTRQAAGEDRCLDSTVAVATGQAEVTVGPAGSVDHCVDAGVRRLNRLGDLVWVDADRDGLQDDGEPGVAGIRVVVRGDDGAQVAETTTGEDGRYLFAALPDGTYTVCFDQATLPEQYAEYGLTRPRAGAADRDSDADPTTWCTGATTLGPGRQEDLTLDAGIVRLLNRLGDLVWHDRNGNGIQDSGEPGVADARVTARDVTTGELREVRTGGDGQYLFDELPNGTYQVCVDRSALPTAFAGHALTKRDAGDDSTDSDADPATWCAPETTLGPSKRADLTLDFGLHRKASGGGLPSTGVAIGLLTALGALVTVAGLVLLRLSRRREPTQAAP